VPLAQATESTDEATGNTITTFNDAPNYSDQQDESKDADDGRNDGNTSSSSSELCISLNDKLKWFLSFETPDYLNDLHDMKDDLNYRAFIGFHIAI
jgi:hypothetical protein